MKKLLVKVGWILLILFCLGVLISAYTIVTDLEDESLGQIYSDFYTFNPKNIFTDYKLGGRDLFSMIPMDDLSDDVLESLPEYPPTKRKQQDYLETLNIFYEINFQKPFT